MLEIGARLRQPMFPDFVAEEAVRGLACFVRIVGPQHVPTLLIRCLHGNFGQVAADIVAVLVDVVAQNVPVDARDLCQCVAAVLEELALGREVEHYFVSRIVLLTEVCVERCGAAENLLNAFMGVTVKWLETGRYDCFVMCLDTWIAILDVLQPGSLCDRVHVALSKLLLDTCLSVPLQSVPYPLARSFHWARLHDLVHVAEDVEYSAMLFNTCTSTDDECTRQIYTEKCIETLVTICCQSRAACLEMAAFCTNQIKERATVIIAGGQVEALDVVLNISLSIIPLLGDQHRPLFAVVCQALVAGVWTCSEPIGVALIRSAVAGVKYLHQYSEEEARDIGGRLLGVAKQVLVSAASEPVLVAAAVLTLALDQYCGKMLFTTHPPLDIKLVVSVKYPVIAALSMASLVRWCLVPRREAGLPQKWTDEEWNMRMKMCQEMCINIFVDLAIDPQSIDRIYRMAALFHVATKAVFGVQGNTSAAIWQAFAKDTSQKMTNFIQQLCQLMSKVDDDIRASIANTLCCILHAINSMLQTCRRHADTMLPNHIIQYLLPVAQSSVSLARATLVLIREQLVITDNLVLPGIDLASTVVHGGEQDAAIAGIGVISEAVKNHWLLFWPNQGNCSPQLAASFEKAMNSLMHALQSEQLSICREALLSLQTLHAARRLLSRKPFRHMCALQIVQQSLYIMGVMQGRESLFDEALTVIWGIAQTDLSQFQQMLRQIVMEWGMGDAAMPITKMEGVEGRNSFTRWIRDAVNDIAVWKLNKSKQEALSL